MNYTKENTPNGVYECYKGRRCGRFKTCETCNRIRQARLCDITELASRFSGHATYAVVMPYGQAQNQETIKKLKTNLTRKLRKSTDGLMMSVETSANDALHLNLIINSEQVITPKPFQTIAKNLHIEADIFVEEITKDDVRKATAYALKRQSIPTSDQYKGNTANLSGDMKTIKQVMQSWKMIQRDPLIAITSMSNTLVALGLEPPTKALLETPRLQRSLDNLIFLTEQLKGLDVCYSKERGILTAQEFKAIYNRKIGQCKSDLTRKNDRYIRKMSEQKLPTGISLKEHLSNNYNYFPTPGD